MGVRYNGIAVVKVTFQLIAFCLPDGRFLM